MFKQPEIVIPQHIDIPEPEIHRATNGIKIYSLKNRNQKVTRFSIVLRAGSSYQSVPFSASATLNMLSEGSSTMTAQQIAEQLDYFGSYFEVSADRDYAVITFCSLDKFFDDTLELARQILLDPVFPQEELHTYCEKRKQDLTIERSKAATKARELFARKLFGSAHPYGISSDESLYDTLTRQHLTDFYKVHYTAGSCFMACSIAGDGQLNGLLRLAESFPACEYSDNRVFPAPESSPYGFALQSDAVQSAIRIGRRLFTRMHPDFIGMQVLATALGGYFGSRLVQNLREKHGYTYGVFSSMVNFEREGYLAIATQVGSQFTAPAVREIFNEMNRLTVEPIGCQELECVKNMMFGEIMRILDGPFGIVDAIIENVQNGTDMRQIERTVRRIREITSEEILFLASKHLVPEHFTVVISGNKDSDIETELYYRQ